MSNVVEKTMYNPDVLNCLANLSNDEVFTSPTLVNQILDLLPQDLFRNPSTTFLDPCTKTGVFLREITKRLIEGLKDEIPDLQERVNHILKNQVYGIAITELTSLIARRSLYCSSEANSQYSIANVFDDEKGNILFNRVEHNWDKNGKCVDCGANGDEYDRDESLENHAYEFIHSKNIEELFGVKFDVVIGNPPYQLNVGNTSGNSSKARAIYHNFVSQAMKLNPRYLTMIIPSRWMTKSAEGISDSWVDGMINDKRIRIIHDFFDASECFPGVKIGGGVCYFLWDRDYEGRCHYVAHREDGNSESRNDYLNSSNVGIVIRDIRSHSIVEKISTIEKNYLHDENKNFTSLVSPKDFFTNKTHLTSSWDGYKKTEDAQHNIKYYLNKNIHKNPYGWVSESDIPKNAKSSKLHKVYISAAYGFGNDSQILGCPFYGEPNSVCSQTYLVIGYDVNKHSFSKEECNNIISYIKTKFFRYLVSIKKKTQNGPRGVYQFVPIQDFSKPWTDAELYAKYKLTQEEIDFIESMVRPMNQNTIEVEEGNEEYVEE